MTSGFRVFFREFRQQFHTTGAIAPSSRHLGRALARHVAAAGPAARILEVGPGTGAVTAEVIRALGDSQRLDLVELNAAFVAHLNGRFETDPMFRRAASRSRVLHQGVETLDSGAPYEAVVSSLPLNNFPPEVVAGLVEHLLRLTKPGGTLSFFEYVAIRRLKGVLGSRLGRERIRGIDRVIGAALAQHEFARDRVWRNFPPAWVHHLRPAEKDGRR
jgi:phosphatidylethanolamine/phosphatidyl-N-methylethanolamine N-methyltransferase